MEKMWTGLTHTNSHSNIIISGLAPVSQAGAWRMTRSGGAANLLYIFSVWSCSSFRDKARLGSSHHCKGSENHPLPLQPLQEWLRKCRHRRMSSAYLQKTATGWWFWAPLKLGRPPSSLDFWTRGLTTSTRPLLRTFIGNSTASGATFTSWTFWTHLEITPFLLWGGFQFLPVSLK